MKKTHAQYFFALALLLPLFSFSQGMATIFQKAINQGISLSTLDSLYQSALHSDSLQAAFAGQEQEFQNAYISMLQALGDFLRDNNFKWGKQIQCFNRIYINKDGRIDYFLFNFKPGEIDPEKTEVFEELLSEFIKLYQFPLTKNKNFAQCSPVRYTDK